MVYIKSVLHEPITVHCVQGRQGMDEADISIYSWKPIKRHQKADSLGIVGHS